MARVVLLQLAVALMTAVLAVLLGGRDAGISSLLGGLSCVVPNGLFALGLHVSERRMRSGTLGPFYFWELVKVFLTILLTVAVFWMYRGVHWLAYLISFVIVLKSYIFLLFRFKKY